MKQLLIIAFISFFSFQIKAQNPKARIEINPYLKWDSYPKFITSFNSVTNSTITMKGINWGITGSYLYPLKNNLFIKIGIGYYKYSFNSIKQYNSLFGTSDNRRINYPGGSSTFGYVCNKYWYNNITTITGLEKLFWLNKNIGLVTGLDMINYYTYSQQYNIPGASSDAEYRRTKGRYFGFAFNIHGGLEKGIGNIKIGPTISLPIFMKWKQDMVFPEEQDSKNRSKWLNGVVVGITCRFFLTSKL